MMLRWIVLSSFVSMGGCGSGQAVATDGADALPQANDVGTAPDVSSSEPVPAFPLSPSDVGACATIPVIFCNNGYQRIIFDPSDSDVYCIPIIGTNPPKVANPCGTGQPYDYHANDIVRCIGYDAGPGC